MIKISSLLAATAVFASSQAEVLFNNATAHGMSAEGLRTSSRNGGGSWSEIQEGNMVCGFRGSVNPGAIDRLADDFSVKSSGWTLTGAAFFMYQTDAVGVTINGGLFEVHRNLGGLVGPLVATGRFAGASVTDIFRIFRNQPYEGRRIQRIDVNFNIDLGPGDYFVVWAATGALNRTGPWSPYLTKAGWQTSPGANALQSNTGGATWMHIQDGLKNQDLPFILYGDDGIQLDSIDPHGPPSP